MALIRYLQNLPTGRATLWCYFIWWSINVIHHFDGTPRIWLTSLGLSGIIGVALILSTRTASGTRAKMEPWVVFRLFMMPFCVSSFSALVKDKGYILVFPPSWRENATGVGVILLFLLIVRIAKSRVPATGAQ